MSYLFSTGLEMKLIDQCMLFLRLFLAKKEYLIFKDLAVEYQG